MVQVRLAEENDHGEIFTLQRAAFVDEARLYGTPSVPALDETLEQLTRRMVESTSWVACKGPRIVGAVSLRDYRKGGPDIERLMVAPDQRGQGLSRTLLDTAEDAARSAGHHALQLIVGDLATDNIAIYTHLGWTTTASHQLDGFDHVLLHTMTKDL